MSVADLLESALPWIEVMSLENQLEEVVLSMHQLQDWLDEVKATAALPNMKDTVDVQQEVRIVPGFNLDARTADCLRFSMQFFYPIQQCAQQVYHTALPLSPTLSYLHKSYLQSATDNHLSCVAAFSGAPDTWGSLLRAISVRQMQLTCIATFVHGIVAVCNNVVNIYGAVTGVLQQSICAPDTVTNIQGSSDGSILFFAHTSSVTMWDVQTGGLIHTFITHSRTSDIAVSTTGEHIACGSSDGSITFWNIHSKKEGKSFGNGQLVVAIHWLSSQRLMVATKNALYTCDIVANETSDILSIPGCVWGMVYLKDVEQFALGISHPSPGVGEKECSILTTGYKKPPEKRPMWQKSFPHIVRLPARSKGLLSPILVGKEIVCMTPASGVQVFNTIYQDWPDNPPLLDTATSVAVLLNRNIVAQIKDSIQLFSFDVLASGSTGNHMSKHSSHVYPFGRDYIICVLQPTRHLTLLELETMQKLPPHDDPLLPESASTIPPSLTCMSSSCGLVAGFDISLVMQAWRAGAPVPEWTEAIDEDPPLSGLSPGLTCVVTVYTSPLLELCVKEAKDGTILAKLPLKQDDFGKGKVYDIVFDSETRFYLKVDGPGGHIQIPYWISTSPSGHYSHTITKGKPVLLSEPQVLPPYTLDEHCEWVIDSESRKICWIPLGNIRRGNGGHFWAGLSLIMVGDDGVVRKLSFKEPGGFGGSSLETQQKG